MIVAYTLGKTESYDQALATEPPEKCVKMEGGWIWRSVEEAEAFLWSEDFLKVDWGDNILRPPEKFSVYKIELVNGWQDVSPIPGKDGIYHLLVNSRFYK
jgi:hypothetical protein